MKKTLLLAAAVLALTAPPAAAGKDSACRTSSLPWKHLESAKAPGAPVRVWFDARYPADEKRARSQAREIGGTIMPAFRKVLGRRPLSDAKVKCRHGSDGRTDVYIVRGKRPELSGTRVAVAVPFTTQEPCEVHAPYLVLMKPRLPRTVLAHELFHVMQAAYARKGGCVAYNEWDEATATWAQDFVYPKDDDHHRYLAAFNFPTLPLTFGGYGAWTFVRYLTETQGGPSRVRTLLETMETTAANRTDADNVVDAAIPGGFAARLPDFALYAWNDAPVPTGRVASAFRSWDALAAVPQVGASAKALQPTPAVDVTLAGAPSRTDTLERDGQSLRVLSREYFHYRFADDVRHVDVLNRWKGVPGAHLTGFAKVDGEWQVVDWTGEQTKTFCRDTAGEDLQELVLALTNDSYEQRISGAARPQVVSTPSCAISVKVTAFRETQRDETDRGWSSSDHHTVGEQPVSTLRVVRELPTSYEERVSYCTTGQADCQFDLWATTEHVRDGVVDGESSVFETCPHAYGVRTFGPFEAIGIGALSVDFSGEEPTAVLLGGVGHAEVGDATANTCGGHSWASPKDRTSVALPWDRLLRGEPVTLTYALAGTAPTLKPSASAEVHFDKAVSLTIQRVDDDGSSFGTM